VFCAPACRTAYHTAARRWAEAGVAAGVLTIADIRKGGLAACALLPPSNSPVSLSEHRKPVPMAPAESADEAAQLLDEVLHALLSLPPDEWSWLVYYRLPGELVEKLRDLVEPKNRPRFPNRRR
jgi:hypothetical protein